MASRVASSASRRVFSTSTRARTTLPSGFNTPRNTAPLVAATAATAAMSAAVSSVPKLGRVARWYLPAMAGIALGVAYIPATFFTEPTKRSVTLGEATRRINYGIAYQLDRHSHQAEKSYEPTQEERNWAIMNSYGDRSSLEDMEKAIAGYESAHGKPMTQRQRNATLEEAYGDRTHVKHLQRAMQIYEVQ